MKFKTKTHYLHRSINELQMLIVEYRGEVEAIYCKALKTGLIASVLVPSRGFQMTLGEDTIVTFSEHFISIQKILLVGGELQIIKHKYGMREAHHY